MVCTGACNFGDGCKCGRQKPKPRVYFDHAEAFICHCGSQKPLLRLDFSVEGRLTKKYICSDCIFAAQAEAVTRAGIAL
jgi:hypothetical protein